MGVQNVYEGSAEWVAEKLIEAFAIDARLPQVAPAASAWLSRAGRA